MISNFKQFSKCAVFLFRSAKLMDHIENETYVSLSIAYLHWNIFSFLAVANAFRRKIKISSMNVCMLNVNLDYNHVWLTKLYTKCLTDALRFTYNVNKHIYIRYIRNIILKKKMRKINYDEHIL